MPITHNQTIAALWLLTMVSSVTAGLLIGHWWWPSKRQLDDAYEEGYNVGLDAGYDNGYHGGLNDLEIELSSRGYTGPSPHHMLTENVSRPGDSGGRTAEASGLATMPDVIAGPGREVRPANSSPVAGRTIYHELAELSDPPPDGPESHAEPSTGPQPVLDPHWYSKRLHELADWQTDWHSDAAAFDAWLPGYLEWFRQSLEPSWSRASRMLEAL